MILSVIGLALGIKGAIDLCNMAKMEVRERTCDLKEPKDVMSHLGIKRVNGSYQDYQLKYYLDFLDRQKPLTKEELESTEKIKKIYAISISVV